MVQAIQDLHQCTFASAILTQQCMYLAVLYVKDDAIVGKHTRETFAYAAHFEAINTRPAGWKFIGFDHGTILRKNTSSGSDLGSPNSGRASEVIFVYSEQATMAGESQSFRP